MLELCVFISSEQEIVSKPDAYPSHNATAMWKQFESSVGIVAATTNWNYNSISSLLQEYTESIKKTPFINYNLVWFC